MAGPVGGAKGGLQATSGLSPISDYFSESQCVMNPDIVPGLNQIVDELNELDRVIFTSLNKKIDRAVAAVEKLADKIITPLTVAVDGWIDSLTVMYQGLTETLRGRVMTAVSDVPPIEARFPPIIGGTPIFPPISTNPDDWRCCSSPDQSCIGSGWYLLLPGMTVPTGYCWHKTNPTACPSGCDNLGPPFVYSGGIQYRTPAYPTYADLLAAYPLHVGYAPTCDLSITPPPPPPPPPIGGPCPIGYIEYPGPCKLGDIDLGGGRCCHKQDVLPPPPPPPPPPTICPPPIVCPPPPPCEHQIEGWYHLPGCHHFTAAECPYPGMIGPYLTEEACGEAIGGKKREEGCPDDNEAEWILSDCGLDKYDEWFERFGLPTNPVSDLLTSLPIILARHKQTHDMPSGRFGG